MKTVSILLVMVVAIIGAEFYFRGIIVDQIFDHHLKIINEAIPPPVELVKEEFQAYMDNPAYRLGDRILASRIRLEDPGLAELAARISWTFLMAWVICHLIRSGSQGKPPFHRSKLMPGRQLKLWRTGRRTRR